VSPSLLVRSSGLSASSLAAVGIGKVSTAINGL